MSLSLSPFDAALQELRDEHRLKANIDFAFTEKYGEVRVMCPEVFVSIVIACLARHGIRPVAVATY